MLRVRVADLQRGQFFPPGFVGCCGNPVERLTADLLAAVASGSLHVDRRDPNGNLERDLALTEREQGAYVQALQGFASDIPAVVVEPEIPDRPGETGFETNMHFGTPAVGNAISTDRPVINPFHECHLNGVETILRNDGAIDGIAMLEIDEKTVVRSLRIGIPVHAATGRCRQFGPNPEFGQADTVIPRRGEFILMGERRPVLIQQSIRGNPCVSGYRQEKDVLEIRPASAAALVHMAEAHQAVAPIKIAGATRIGVGCQLDHPERNGGIGNDPARAAGTHHRLDIRRRIQACTRHRQSDACKKDKFVLHKTYRFRYFSQKSWSDAQE